MLSTPLGVYLAARSQSEASSQQQDDVPGHPLVDHLPVEQRGGSVHHFTCETQTTCEHEVISLKEQRRLRLVIIIQCYKELKSRSREHHEAVVL